MVGHKVKVSPVKLVRIKSGSIRCWAFCAFCFVYATLKCADACAAVLLQGCLVEVEANMSFVSATVWASRDAECVPSEEHT